MILKYFTLTAALLLIQVGSVYAHSPKTYTGTVLSVGDGDTIKAKFGNNKITLKQPDPHGFDRDKDGIGCERN